MNIRNVKDKDIEFLKQNKLEIILNSEKNNKIDEKELKELNNYIDDEIKKEFKNYKILEENSKVIGDILVIKYKDGHLIDEIYIINEYRNKKIGSKILEKIINKIENNLSLWVYKNNIYAIKLYKKYGFQIKKETENRYFMEYNG